MTRAKQDSVTRDDQPIAHVTVEREKSLRPVEGDPDGVITLKDLEVYYGDFRAVTDVDMSFGSREITALIGPSGCGKSTVLRCLNRMNDLVPGARVEGVVAYHGTDISAR